MRTLLVGFILINVVTVFHAYRFTHFSEDSGAKFNRYQILGTSAKIQALLFGVKHPRPSNDNTPNVAYETIQLNSNKRIECWSIPVANSKGTIILFHGYGGRKSSQLGKAEIFRKMGYNTLLVDFMGSGGSEGNQTTIGHKEAEQVKTCYDHISSNGEKKIYLHGNSMGAVAIMKAISDFHLQPAGIMVECPYGTLYKTVCARFQAMGTPTFIVAGLLTFWGGIENGFWAFGLNPIDFANQISCPTLLMYGAKDDNVSRKEIDDIYANLKGPRQLKVYPQSGHEFYTNKHKKDWTEDVEAFLKKY